MGQNELISIIIPAYNVANYIEECLISICEQTYQNLEILVIDDGSTDATLDKCKNFSDERIKIVSQENQGVSAARNLGICLAQGEWIVFVDADDKMQSMAIEKALNVAHKQNADTVCWNCYAFREHVSQIDFLAFAPQKEFLIEGSNMTTILEALYYTFDMKKFYPGQMFRAVWGKLLKKSIIREHNVSFPFNMPLGEDAAFLADYFVNTKKVVFIDEAWNAYRISMTSAVGRYRDNILELQRMEKEKIEKIFAHYKEKGTILINYYMECDRQYINNMRKAKMRKIYMLREIYKFIRMSDREKIQEISYHKIQHRKILLAWSIKHRFYGLEACISQFF